MAIANLLAAACATLWPFQFRLDAASISRKWSRVEWVFVYHDRRGHLTIDRDLLLNLLLLLPLGLGFALARSARGRRVLVEALLLGALTALCIEGAQLLTPHRVTQLADLWRNTLGCVVGAGIGVALRAKLSMGRNDDTRPQWDRASKLSTCGDGRRHGHGVRW